MLMLENITIRIDGANLKARKRSKSQSYLVTIEF